MITDQNLEDIANDAFNDHYNGDNFRKSILHAVKAAMSQAHDGEVIGWWNGMRKDDPEAGTYRSFSEVEDTYHDIPIFAGVNPCNTAPPRVVVDEAMVLRACNAYDDARDHESSSEYPAMHAALKAALEQSK